MKATLLGLGLLVSLTIPVGVHAQKLSRDEKMQRDRARVTEQGIWIYNDLEAGFAEARRTGKPLMVVLRCVPCEECVKLDDDLVDKDPGIAPLLDRFVCVRQVSTNGLDLSIFQYDTDQSFAVFFLNADGTVYGRFGTRSHRTEWFGDVSLEGLARAMDGALELHAEYPANRSQLVGKQGVTPDVDSPEKYPALRDKYTSRLKSGSELVKSCIHCHQIGDAQREFYWNQNSPFPTRVLFQYPHPKTVGLILDPTEKSTVREVVPGSAAEKAGLQVGDSIVSIDGQPLLSMADVQWVLHHSEADGDRLAIVVQRSGQERALQLELSPGWRDEDDLSWRASTWGLRRMVTGGLVLEPATEEERSEAGIPSGKMALRVKHVGQYGPHAAAKNAGFQSGDIVVSYDGQTDLVRETDLIAHAVRNHRSGARVSVEIVRKGQSKELVLPIQP